MLYRINNGERKLITVERLIRGMNELASAPMEYDVDIMQEGIREREALIPLAKDPINVYEVNWRLQLITK